MVTGLVDGLRHLREPPGPRRRGWRVIASHRYWFGIASVMLVLLYRNYFYAAEDADAAFAALSTAALVGRRRASWPPPFVTPVVTERIAPRALGARRCWSWPGSPSSFPAGLFTEPGVLVSAFVLGLASQGIKICVDTFVQTGVDDAFRGRVFSLYDVLFNVAFVAAAATAAVVLPADGRSHVVLGGCCPPATCHRGRPTGPARRGLRRPASPGSP